MSLHLVIIKMKEIGSSSPKILKMVMSQEDDFRHFICFTMDVVISYSISLTTAQITGRCLEVCAKVQNFAWLHEIFHVRTKELTCSRALYTIRRDLVVINRMCVYEVLVNNRIIVIPVV